MTEIKLKYTHELPVTSFDVETLGKREVRVRASSSRNLPGVLFGSAVFTIPANGCMEIGWKGEE